MCDEKKCCGKPDRLTNKPQECTAVQINMCHGDTKVHPCIPIRGCHDPVRLKDVPEACSPMQIRECHGEAKGHPYA